MKYFCVTIKGFMLFLDAVILKDYFIFYLCICHALILLLSTKYKCMLWLCADVYDLFLLQGVIEFSLCLFFAKLVSYTFLFWLPKYISAKSKWNFHFKRAGTNVREDNVIAIASVSALAAWTKNFNLCHNFPTIKDRAFIFDMCIPYDKTFTIILTLWPWSWSLTYRIAGYFCGYKFLRFGHRIAWINFYGFYFCGRRSKGNNFCGPNNGLIKDLIASSPE